MGPDSLNGQRLERGQFSSCFHFFEGLTKLVPQAGCADRKPYEGFQNLKYAIAETNSA
jgi:hypothetical protein